MYMRYIQVYVIDVDRKKKEDFLRHTVMLFENNFFLVAYFCIVFVFKQQKNRYRRWSLSNIYLIAALHANTSICFSFF